jgi:Zn-dependent protease
MSDTLYSIATWLVPLTIAIVFHEVAHGLVARQFGDPTAERMGRLTLNPIKHVDPVGTLILPMLLAVANAPIFGWAKPVPVRADRMRNPRRDMIIVALAGPGMNLVLAVAATAILAVGLAMGGGDPMSPGGFIASNAINFLLINIFLAVFNLIPLPPFDGGHVVEGLLPRPLAAPFRQLGRFSLPILFGLLLILPALWPEANIVAKAVTPVVQAIARLFLEAAGLSAV